MTVTYPDGSTVELEKGAVFLDAAKSISEGFARNVLVAGINGELYDLNS